MISADESRYKPSDYYRSLVLRVPPHMVEEMARRDIESPSLYGRIVDMQFKVREPYPT